MPERPARRMVQMLIGSRWIERPAGEPLTAHAVMDVDQIFGRNEWQIARRVCETQYGMESQQWGLPMRCFHKRIE